MKNFETLREELIFRFKSLEMTARREIKEGFHLDITNCDLYEYRLKKLEQEIYYESISDEDYAELDKLRAMRINLVEQLDAIALKQLLDLPIIEINFEDIEFVQLSSHEEL